MFPKTNYAPGEAYLLEGRQEMTNDELSREVAERVMGWVLNRMGLWVDIKQLGYAEALETFSPATNTSQAFEVVEKFERDNNHKPETYWLFSLYYEDGEYSATWKQISLVVSGPLANTGATTSTYPGLVRDTNPARAICLATLEAVETERFHREEPPEEKADEKGL